jgi:HEAT repeat protein
VSTSPRQDTTPRHRIEAECGLRGTHEVVAGCIALLNGDAHDRQLLSVLGGVGAPHLMSGRSHADVQMWQRIWATRGLLWAWDDSALDALRGALSDESWRVREMAAKVVARHLLGDLVGPVAAMRDDPVPRVRQAAERALSRIALARA